MEQETIPMVGLLLISVIIWVATVELYIKTILYRALVGGITPLHVLSLVVFAVASIVCALGIVTKILGHDLL